jgi:hypothetical protein
MAVAIRFSNPAIEQAMTRLALRGRAQHRSSREAGKGIGYRTGLFP